MQFYSLILVILLQIQTILLNIPKVMSQPILQPSTQFKRVLKIIIIVSAVYLSFVCISVPTLIMTGVIVSCLIGLIKLKIAQIKEKGPQNFSPKIRELLFEKSIFDIYSDILYFPTISKIIAAFVRPALAKPHPQQLKEFFVDIHPKAKQIISRKGLLNLFPDKIRAIGYKQDQPLPLVKSNDWSWYNAQKYKLNEQVHEDTLGKRILDRVDNKINWQTLAGLIFLVGYGIKTMNPKRARKMLVQNGCFAGILVVIMIGLIKLSRKSRNKHGNSHLSIQAKIVQQ